MSDAGASFGFSAVDVALYPFVTKVPCDPPNNNAY